MKTKNTTVEPVLKYNRITEETEAKSIPLTHKYITAHISGWVQTLQ
jgi:hypothetical protein